MQKADSLIRTKLRPPFTRPELVARPRLQERLAQGLCCPLTLVIAPAGFGKTTLVAACMAGSEFPVAWLSLDKDDNQENRFMRYLVAALQTANPDIGSEAAILAKDSQQAQSEALLTSLINELDSSGTEIALVLDDYQFISSQIVHEAVAFLLEHCPRTLHLVIATRSDPPLPLARLRARGHAVELRSADLRFTEPEAAQFLNDVMGLHLDAKSIAILEERTEGWIAGLQMAALSMRDRQDVIGFIESFSGTNRYILDYLLEEVLANQPPEIQRFLLYTSILERLTAPLCEAITDIRGWRAESSDESRFSTLDSQSILEHLDRTNLFLVPLDDEREWYRYHHLFADLLRTQLQNSIGDQNVAQLHLRASEWYERNGATIDAIHHASLASDFERIERLIEQNYTQMMNRGEMSWVRFWMGKLSRELVYQRPWLCLYEAMNRSWFGQLDEATLLLNEAEKRIRSEDPSHDISSMLGYHAYVKSRVTAMQGDTRQAIELCHKARETIPADNLGLQIDVSITLGYEYFLYGDFENASRILNEMIRSGINERAVNNPVAGYAILARAQVYQGRLHAAYELLQKAAGLIHEPGGQYLGVTGLIEVETAALLYEWNDLETALARIKRGLEFLPAWGKADDTCLAYTTLSRIYLARGELVEAASAIEKVIQLIQTCGVFSEARSAVETAHVKLWLALGDWSSIDRWTAALDQCIDSQGAFRYEDELAHITQARVMMAQDKLDEAIRLCSWLEELARSGGRQGRLLEILILKALATQAAKRNTQALDILSEILTIVGSEGYMRIFLDEGQPMQLLLAQWLSHASPGSLRDYATNLLTQFNAEQHEIMAEAEKAVQIGISSASSVQLLVEPLSERELEVLQLIALGLTNREIASQLIVASGTIKAHTASIYRKLDVTNRTEAASRARLLGILP